MPSQTETQPVDLGSTLGSRRRPQAGVCGPNDQQLEASTGQRLPVGMTGLCGWPELPPLNPPRRGMVNPPRRGMDTHAVPAAKTRGAGGRGRAEHQSQGRQGRLPASNHSGIHGA